MKKKTKIETTHRIWHTFYEWMIKTYGKDLHGKLQVHRVKNPETGKIHLLKYRNFNELELSRRVTGYEAMCKVKRYIGRYLPEIKIVHVDDSVFAGSDVLLIPHPAMGITVMFIPQCTTIQNQFFLYENHYKGLLKALKQMKDTYKPIK